jgi:hypothetical protein
MTIKVKDMRAAAKRMLDRAVGTKIGVWCLVGWDGEGITASDKVRSTLPCERVEARDGEALGDVEMRLAMAAMRLRSKIADALSKPRKAQPSPRKLGNPLARKGIYRSREKPEGK